MQSVRHTSNDSMDHIHPTKLPLMKSKLKKKRMFQVFLLYPKFLSINIEREKMCVAVIFAGLQFFFSENVNIFFSRTGRTESDQSLTKSTALL